MTVYLDLSGRGQSLPSAVARPSIPPVVISLCAPGSDGMGGERRNEGTAHGLLGEGEAREAIYRIYRRVSSQLWTDAVGEWSDRRRSCRGGDSGSHRITPPTGFDELSHCLRKRKRDLGDRRQETRRRATRTRKVFRCATQLTRRKPHVSLPNCELVHLLFWLWLGRHMRNERPS